MKMNSPKNYTGLRVRCAALMILLLLPSAKAQFSPDVLKQFNNTVGSRVEALSILGGDFGLSGGTYSADSGADLTVSKFGGMGDIGTPKPIGNTGIAWQPRLQGSMGTVSGEQRYKEGELAGDKTHYETFAIQFGGGGRFWFNDHFSIAPTFMGMYGHAYNNYQARSTFWDTHNVEDAKKAGLIDWEIDTWTVRPAVEGAYIFLVGRTIFTLSSAFTYYHTEDFDSSSENLSINSDSESWDNKIDIDIPLGYELWGHELRTGGYFSRTELYDGLQTGLNQDHMYEVHGRLVLDFLGELWKVQWIGLGFSYLWGPHFDGVSYGADVAFRF